MHVSMESPATTVVLPRFGEFTYAADDVLDFPWGIPGFARLRSWLALNLASQPNFVWLQSLDDPAVALPTCDPWSVFPDYDPHLPPYATEALEILSPADFTLLCVVVVTENAQEMTMNLMAPIVVNVRTQRGRQIMLENSNYPVRAAVPRKSPTAERPQ